MKNEDCLAAFAKHLKTLRKERKLSVQNLADKADLDLKTVQRIEYQRLNPSLDTLCSLSIGLEIELNELMNFKFKKRQE